MRLDFRAAPYGPLSIKVDGQEVADRCFLVDTDAGEAHCYLNLDPPVYDGDHGFATVTLRGRVEVIPLPVGVYPEFPAE